MVLVYAQLVFAANAQRLLALGFPAMILFLLNGIDEISKKFQVGKYLFIIPPSFYYFCLLAEPESIRLPFESIAFIVFMVFIFYMGFLKSKDEL